MKKITINHHEILLNHSGRMLFPQDKITNQQRLKHSPVLWHDFKQAINQTITIT